MFSLNCNVSHYVLYRIASRISNRIGLVQYRPSPSTEDTGIELRIFYPVSEIDSSGVVKQDVHCMSRYNLQNHVYSCISLFDQNGT